MKTTIRSLGLVILGIGFFTGCAPKPPASSWSFDKSEASAQLKAFVAEKEAQESVLVEADEKDWGTNFQQTGCRPFFAAAAKGDWQTVSNLFSEIQKRVSSRTNTLFLRGRWWSPVMETYGAMEAFAVGDEKYSKAFGDDIIQSISPGSIYFGGTDPGRFIVTALEKSLVKADPFFTLTQNALADSTYLEYLRSVDGGKTYILTGEDLQKCFQDYVADAQRRLKENQLKPGENFKKQPNGSIQVSGQVAVMEINGLLVKVIFDKNPDREFYIEESFQFDWMYPYLEPHGLIFEINRQLLPALSDEIVQRNHDYWTKTIQPMIGDWLNAETTVKEVATFAKKVFLQRDFSGFTGDPQFVQNDYSYKMFSKERANIADLYVWRMDHALTANEKERMAREADFAFRQALALCPYNSEAVKGYTDFLNGRNRDADAALVAEMAEQFPKQK